LNHLDRIKEVQRQLDLTNRQMAVELRVSEFWYSKIVNGHRPASDDLLLRLDDLMRRKNIVVGTSPAITDHLKLGGKLATVEEAPGDRYKAVASRLSQQRIPSTRLDCEDYVRQLLDAAEASDNPNAWPVIHDRLLKKFPLVEWEPAKTAEK